MTTDPAVNVVIPTFQRPGPLDRTLRALGQQTVRSFVVTVVDDASPKPADQRVAPDLRAEAWLRFVRLQTNSGPARARNIGEAFAQTAFVAFVDDDVVPGPTWLESLLAYAHEGGPGTVVFGPLLAPPDWRPTPWNRWEADTLAKQYRRIERAEYAPTWRQVFTGNALLWRSDFEGAGGFNEEFTRAEDIEFAYRLFLHGCRFTFAPEAIGWHYAERSKRAWMALPRNYARFDRAMDQLYPEMDWLGILRRERRQQAAGLRCARRLVHGHVRRAIIRAAVDASRPAHAARLVSVSTRLLSLAYDLAYQDEIQRGGEAPVLQPHPGSVPGPPQEQAVNGESTPAR